MSKSVETVNVKDHRESPEMFSNAAERVLKMVDERKLTWLHFVQCQEIRIFSETTLTYTIHDVPETILTSTIHEVSDSKVTGHPLLSVEHWGFNIPKSSGMNQEYSYCQDHEVPTSDLTQFVDTIEKWRRKFLDEKTCSDISATWCFTYLGMPSHIIPTATLHASSDFKPPLLRPFEFKRTPSVLITGCDKEPLYCD
jgi:hypothetical protein